MHSDLTFEQHQTPNLGQSDFYHSGLFGDRINRINENWNANYQTGANGGAAAANTLNSNLPHSLVNSSNMNQSNSAFFNNN